MAHIILNRVICTLAVAAAAKGRYLIHTAYSNNLKTLKEITKAMSNKVARLSVSHVHGFIIIADSSSSFPV